MDPLAVRAVFDAQCRRFEGAAGLEHAVERDDRVVRRIGGADGWAGVTWSDLDAGCADAVIAAQISRFADASSGWEWKHYSYDQPPDLGDRLVAAGLTRAPAEAVLVAEIAALRLDGSSVPAGVELQAVIDRQGADALVAVHDEVFGGDHAALGASVLAALETEPPTAAGVVAMAGGVPIAAGRVEFGLGTQFAGLWGGGTLAAWRRRGVFGALVAHRARLAAARGFRYLQVDASPDSRPILQRLGFVELATTTPYTHG